MTNNKTSSNVPLDHNNIGLSSVQTIKEDLSPKLHPMKKVSVIIPTYSIERFAYTCECIDSIRHQTLMPCEILLVLDPDPRLISFYRSHEQEGVTLVVSSGRGLSAARNMGIQNAKGNLIAFIDDDAVAKGDWLESLVENCSDPQVLGVGGYVKPVWESGRPIWFPKELDWVVGCSYAGLGEQRCSVRNPIGCNMLFRKDVFDKAGFFDNHIGRLGKHLMGSEEAEFSIRALGVFPDSKIMYDPQAVVYHWVPSKRSNHSHFFRRSYYEGVSKKMMNQLAANTNQVLSTEKNYLYYLLTVSIIGRIRKISQENALQLAMLAFCTSVVLTGYAITSGKLFFKNFDNNTYEN
jgi:glycosyltransferase involved in cell wall biosynthesis